MKITVNKGDLLAELEYVLKVMPDKPALAVLNNVLIQATEQGVRIAATYPRSRARSRGTPGRGTSYPARQDDVVL